MHSEDGYRARHRELMFSKGPDRHLHTQAYFPLSSVRGCNSIFSTRKTCILIPCPKSTFDIRYHNTFYVPPICRTYARPTSEAPPDRRPRDTAELADQTTCACLGTHSYLLLFLSPLNRRHQLDQPNHVTPRGIKSTQFMGTSTSALRAGARPHRQRSHYVCEISRYIQMTCVLGFRMGVLEWV